MTAKLTLTVEKTVIEKLNLMQNEQAEVFPS